MHGLGGLRKRNGPTGSGETGVTDVTLPNSLVCQSYSPYRPVPGFVHGTLQRFAAHSMAEGMTEAFRVSIFKHAIILCRP